MDKNNNASQMGKNKNAEANAREASKRMGLEFGNELGSQEMGGKFEEAHKGSNSNKSANANLKRNRKNNK